MNCGEQDKLERYPPSFGKENKFIVSAKSE